MPQARDVNGNRMEAVVPVGTPANLAVGLVSQQSAAFTSTMVRLCASVPTRVLFGANPTALQTSICLPAETPEYFGVQPGTKVAAIRDALATTDGTLNIVEC
jgi:hypothetical protein